MQAEVVHCGGSISLVDQVYNDKYMNIVLLRGVLLLIYMQGCGEYYM